MQLRHVPDLSKNHSVCLLCASLFDVGAPSVLVGSDGSCHFACCGCGVWRSLEMFSDIGLAWGYQCNLLYDEVLVKVIYPGSVLL